MWSPGGDVDLQAAPPPRYHSNVGRDFFSRVLEFFPSRQWGKLAGWLAAVARAGCRRGLAPGVLALAVSGLDRFQPRRALGPSPRQHGDYGTASSLFAASITNHVQHPTNHQHPTSSSRSHHNQSSGCCATDFDLPLHSLANSFDFRPDPQRSSLSSSW